MIIDKNTQIAKEFDLQDTITWRYKNAEKLNKLTIARNDLIRRTHYNFWREWFETVFNFETFDDFGCEVWSRLLNIKFIIDDNSESKKFLTTNDKRMILKLKFYAITSGTDFNSSFYAIKQILGKQSSAICSKNKELVQITLKRDSYTDYDLLYILHKYPLIPLPAGVGFHILFVENKITFNPKQGKNLSHGNLV